MSESPRPPREAVPAPTAREAVPAVDVQTLLGGRTEIRLIHRAEEYRLRVTKQGKLLLTK